jgi:hypothetical protein
MYNSVDLSVPKRGPFIANHYFENSVEHIRDCLDLYRKRIEGIDVIIRDRQVSDSSSYYYLDQTDQKCYALTDLFILEENVHDMPPYLQIELLPLLRAQYNAKHFICPLVKYSPGVIWIDVHLVCAATRRSVNSIALHVSKDLAAYHITCPTEPLIDGYSDDDNSQMIDLLPKWPGWIKAAPVAKPGSPKRRRIEEGDAPPALPGLVYLK